MKKEELEIISKNISLYPEVIIKLGLDSKTEEKVLTIIKDYIDNHKWLVNEKIPYTITIDQAFFSWYENVFRPQISAMEGCGISNSITGTKLEKFDMVSKEHYFLQTENRYVNYSVACDKVIIRESKSALRRLLAKIRLKY